MDEMDEISGQLQAKYSKLMTARDTLDAVQEQMDGLVEKYDTVSPEDVVTSAGKLVAVGLPAEEMAGLLADMPDNAQALQDWVGQHAKDVVERSAQVDAMLLETRHQMGVVGLKQLAGQTAMPAAPPAGPSEMMPSAPAGPAGPLAGGMMNG
jgi:hypothetical protein